MLSTSALDSLRLHLAGLLNGGSVVLMDVQGARLCSNIPIESIDILGERLTINTGKASGLITGTATSWVALDGIQDPILSDDMQEPRDISKDAELSIESLVYDLGQI